MEITKIGIERSINPLGLFYKLNNSFTSGQSNLQDQVWELQRYSPTGAFKAEH